MTSRKRETPTTASLRGNRGLGGGKVHLREYANATNLEESSSFSLQQRHSQHHQDQDQDQHHPFPTTLDDADPSFFFNSLTAGFRSAAGSVLSNGRSSSSSSSSIEKVDNKNSNNRKNNNRWWWGSGDDSIHWNPNPNPKPDSVNNNTTTVVNTSNDNRGSSQKTRGWDSLLLSSLGSINSSNISTNSNTSNSTTSNSNSGDLQASAILHESSVRSGSGMSWRLFDPLDWNGDRLGRLRSEQDQQQQQQQEQQGKQQGKEQGKEQEEQPSLQEIWNPQHAHDLGMQTGSSLGGDEFAPLLPHASPNAAFCKNPLTTTNTTCTRNGRTGDRDANDNCNDKDNVPPTPEECPKQPPRWSGIVAKLKSLSAPEKHLAALDVHGLAEHTPTEGDPRVLARTLATLDKLLQNEAKSVSLVGRNGHYSSSTFSSALGRAVIRCPSRVAVDKLKFVRAVGSNDDPGAALARMKAYYSTKQRYFGTETLGRDLTLEDLTLEERTLYVRAGAMQLLEEKDRSGRTVTMLFGKLVEGIPRDALVRMILYGSEILTRDESIQIAGYVHIVWAHGMASNWSSPTALVTSKTLMEVRNCLPIRCVAKHFCYERQSSSNNNLNLRRPLYGALVHGLDAFQAVRTRIHCGSVTECVYNLMTYGISRDSIPVAHERVHEPGHCNNQKPNAGGSDGRGDTTTTMIIDTEFHLAFVEALEEREKRERELERHQQLQQQQQQQQQLQQSAERAGRAFGGSTTTPDDTLRSKIESETQKETESSSPVVVVVVLLPGPLDIVMGRGGQHANKSGNLRFKKLLEERFIDYDTASTRAKKTALVKEILDTLAASGARFLQPEKDHESSYSTSSSRGGVFWTVASPQKAHDKVAHDFRNLRKRAVAAKAEAKAEKNAKS